MISESLGIIKNGPFLCELVIRRCPILFARSDPLPNNPLLLLLLLLLLLHLGLLLLLLLHLGLLLHINNSILKAYLGFLTMAKRRETSQRKKGKRQPPLIDNIPKYSQQRRSSPPKRRTDFSSLFCYSSSIAHRGIF